LFVLFVLFY